MDSDTRTINFIDSDSETFNLPKKNKMYFILTYDITKPKRLVKALKTCRKYLNWVQKSVFEGHLTESQYKSLIGEMKKIIKKEEDSLITYCVNDLHYLQKEIIGVDKNEITNFI